MVAGVCCHSRLARRGGVKRLSATVYDEIRASMKMYLNKVRVFAKVMVVVVVVVVVVWWWWWWWGGWWVVGWWVVVAKGGGGGRPLKHKLFGSDGKSVSDPWRLLRLSRTRGPQDGYGYRCTLSRPVVHFVLEG